MNKYFNYGRIKAIIANIKESINDLDNALYTYENLNDDKYVYNDDVMMNDAEFQTHMVTGLANGIDAYFSQW